MSIRISRLSDVAENVTFGQCCIVWSFAVICPGVVLGDYCVVGSHVYIGRNTIIGEGTRIQDAAHLTDHMLIGKNCYIGAHVVTMNDKYPVVYNPGYERQSPSIEDDSSIGCGAIILPGVRIGRRCLIGAGAVVARDVPDNMIVRGEPARNRMAREPYAYQTLES